MTTRITVTGIAPGTPPRLVWHRRSRRLDGAERLFSQALIIPEPALFERLKAEVRSGDVLEITSVTEWGPDHVRTYLTDFKRIGQEPPQRGVDVTTPAPSAEFDRTRYDEPPYAQRVEKPWGYELIFTPPDLPYTGKLLHVAAGKRLSLQYHDQKRETQYLLSGRALLLLDDESGTLHEIEMQTGRGYTNHPASATASSPSKTPTSSRCPPPRPATPTASKTTTGGKMRPKRCAPSPTAAGPARRADSHAPSGTSRRSGRGNQPGRSR
jgi:hypothetical protein